MSFLENCFTNTQQVGTPCFCFMQQGYNLQVFFSITPSIYNFWIPSIISCSVNLFAFSSDQFLNPETIPSAVKPPEFSIRKQIVAKHSSSWSVSIEFTKSQDFMIQGSNACKVLFTDSLVSLLNRIFSASFVEDVPWNCWNSRIPLLTISMEWS